MWVCEGVHVHTICSYLVLPFCEQGILTIVHHGREREREIAKATRKALMQGTRGRRRERGREEKEDLLRPMPGHGESPGPLVDVSVRGREE